MTTRLKIGETIRTPDGRAAVVANVSGKRITVKTIDGRVAGYLRKNVIRFHRRQAEGRK